MRVGIQLDLRNPKPWRKPWQEFYAETIDYIVEAEKLGVDIVKITEHHLWEDGYIPQPLTFLAAVAARTSRIRLMTGIIILPLHSPVEIAEQAALVDCMSGGRLELGFGVGYRVPEYELFGVDIKRRFAIFEEHVGALRKAWERVTPKPLQPEIPLWAGLRGPRGSRMAGRLGMGRLYMGPAENDAESWNTYLEGLDEGGLGRDKARMSGMLQGMLTDDPERSFREIAPLIEYHWNTYRTYGVEGTGNAPPSAMTAEQFREAGAKVGGRLSYGWEMMTPETAARYVKEMAGGRKVDSILLPVAAGQINAHAWRHIELLATKLKPMLT